MSVDIQVTGVENAVGNIEQTKNILEGIGEGLKEAVDSVLLPAIQEASTVVYNVRTGAYSNGWYSELSDPYTVSIRNQVNYAVPLEYGWTLRNGSFRESEGVAVPVALESAQAIGEALRAWLKSRLP